MPAPLSRIAGGLHKAWRMVLYASAAFGLLFASVTFLPVLEPAIAALTGPWDEPGGDVLIVLGADSVTGQVLGAGSYWRSVYAVYEWRAGTFRKMVISGGGGMAEDMRGFVVVHGVPAAAVELETQSKSTREQALFVTGMLLGDPGRKVLLTSDYHSYRAKKAFDKSGLRVTVRPCPDAGKRAGSLLLRWPVFLDLVLETAKVAWYRYQGWI